MRMAGDEVRYNECGANSKLRKACRGNGNARNAGNRPCPNKNRADFQQNGCASRERVRQKGWAKCALLNVRRRGICAAGWQGGDKPSLDGEISTYVRDVRAFEVGDPAAR